MSNRSLTTKEHGFSIILVLSIILLATIATTTVYNYLSTENQRSGSRVLAQTAELSMKNAIAQTESWLTHKPDDVVGVIQYMLNYQLAGKTAAVDASAIIGGQIGANMKIVSFKKVNNNTYEFLFNIDAYGANGSRQIKNVGYNVSGFESVGQSNCLSGTFNYAFFNGAKIDCSSADVEIQGDFVNNGVFCWNGRLRIEGNFVNTFNMAIGGDQNNFHGHFEIGGDMYMKGKAMSASYPGCGLYDLNGNKKPTSEFKFQSVEFDVCGDGLDIASGTYSGDLNEFADAEDPDSVTISTTQISANAHEYFATCTDTKNSSTNVKYTATECKVITAKILNDIAENPPGLFQGYTVLQFDKTTESQGAKWADEDVKDAHEILSNNMVFYFTGNVDVTALNVTNNFPRTSKTIQVLAIFENTNQLQLTGRKIFYNDETFVSNQHRAGPYIGVLKGWKNRETNTKYDAGYGNYVFVATTSATMYFAQNDQKDTISGSIFIDDENNTPTTLNTSGGFHWATQSCKSDPTKSYQTCADGKQVIQYNPTVVSNVMKLNFAYEATQTDAQIAACGNPVMVVQAIADQLVLERLGSYSVTSVPASNDDLVLEGVPPQLLTNPPVISIAGAECNNGTTWADLDARITKTKAGDISNCAETITTSPDDIETTINSILNNPTNAANVNHLVTYSMDCGDDGIVTAYTNIILNCEPPAVSSNTGYTAFTVSSAAAAAPEDPTYHGVLETAYQFVNKRTGKCMDVTAQGTANGVNIQQWDCNYSQAQQWQATQLGNGKWELKSIVSGKVVDLEGAGTSNNVQQWGTSAGGKAQRWRIEPGSTSGFYQIKSQYDNSRCVQPLGSNAGANIETRSCNLSTWQEWELVVAYTRTEIIPGIYRLVNNRSHYCIGIQGPSTSNGANIIQWDCNGSNSQNWVVNYLKNGRFILRNAHSNKYLDVSNYSGPNVHQWSWQGALNQKWYISYAENGYFRVQPVSNSGTCLDLDGVEGWNSAPEVRGTSVEVNGCRVTNQGVNDNYATEQKWNFIPVEINIDGYNVFTDDGALDDDITNDGGKLYQWWDCLVSVKSNELQGSNALLANCSDKGGLSIRYDTPVDLNHMSNAVLRFWARSSNPDLGVKVEWGAPDGQPGHGSAWAWLRDYGFVADDTWQEIGISLSDFTGIDLKNMVVPFNIYNNQGGPFSYMVDNVHITYTDNGYTPGDDDGGSGGSGATKLLEAENNTVMSSGLQVAGTVPSYVGYVTDGAWIDWYDVPLQAGTYQLRMRYASWANGNKGVILRLDDQEILTTILYYSTWNFGAGSKYETFNDALSTSFTVSQTKNYKVAVVFDGDGINLDWIKFEPSN
ncbi:MAG: RICIN domain-containing protein [Fibrobacterales bacterium]